MQRISKCIATTSLISKYLKLQNTRRRLCRHETRQSGD